MFIYGQYEVTEEIGEGRNHVYIAEDAKRQKVCLKVLKKNNNTLHQFRLRNEAVALSKLDHPNVIKFRELLETPSHLVLVVEFVDAFDLVDILSFRKCLKGEELASVMLSVARAMHYLHQRGICHRDIKPDNILVDEVGNVKLIDFEFASQFVPFKPTLKKVVGSSVYSAPELLRGDAYCGSSVDVWAYGVTLYACAFGRLPWAGKTNAQVLADVNNKPIPLPARPDLPPALYSLLKGCLQLDPSKRLSSLQILSHEYFHQITTRSTKQPTSEQQRRGLSLEEWMPSATPETFVIPPLQKSHEI